MSSALTVIRKTPVADFGAGISFRIQRGDQRLRKIRQVARIAEEQGDAQTAALARSILRLQQRKSRGPQLPFFL